MALFKLISNGNVTYMELDGKTINGACVQNVSFGHDVRDGKKDVTLHLDLNLHDAYNSSTNGICGILENDGMFEFVNQKMDEREKELREKHSSDAAIMFEAQNYRAETQKATAQNVEVKQMIEEINRRTRIPFHPDISTSKDDTLQEGQPSSDKRG